ncbi:MAG: 2-C-methyl-D-erythritol 2,4-cyclodiphosphate synthase [Deltaproteobacteria bacterium]|nr:2-C-methyl-D-erythritol 2,4-cyclodiphosphate synthase [Deltaproteobacteria bacterium]
MKHARIGHGFDAHQLAEGYELVLGGVQIPYARGLAGHSDGDVLLHAIASALLGALGLGDLGAHFPSSDPRWKGAASAEFVRHALRLARERGYALGNLDATVIAERPRLAPHQPAMRRHVAELLGASEADVNVKVTSTDALGAIGRGEGIAAQAVVLLVPAEAT